MNTLKLILSVVASCIALQVTIAQKTTGRSFSVSQKISNGESEVEILKSWEKLVLQKQIKTYADAEKLVDKTMQLAFLHGNRQLGASITKTAYYSTLTTTLEQEIDEILPALGAMAVRAVGSAVANKAVDKLTASKNKKKKPIKSKIDPTTESIKEMLYRKLNSK